MSQSSQDNETPLAPATAGNGGNQVDPAAARDDLTYGDIVWTQFTRNRVALFSMWVIVGLVLLAVFAPVIASDQPLVWEDQEGQSHPWLSSLFDRNVYISGVDIFFNLLMVLFLPLVVGFGVALRMLRRQPITKRHRRRLIRAVVLSCGALVVVCFVGVSLAPTSSEYRNYPREMERAAEKLQGAEEALAKRSAEEAAGQANLTDLAQLGQAVAEAEAAIPTATFTLFPYSPRTQGFGSVEKPSESHWIGTDQGTRDVGVRLIFGTRVALTVGVIAVAIYVFIGIILGSTAGFFGGRVDLMIQRMIEIMMSVPSFFVILTVVAFVDKPTILHIMVILGLIRWTGVARLVRGEFLRLRKQEFVTAAQALGYRRRRIIFEQILPNALGPVLVAAAFGVASCILIEATLSFLGLGDLTVPSWGQTIKEGYATGAWHLILAPGFAIFVTVSALNLVGEGLRDALDPKLRQ